MILSIFCLPEAPRGAWVSRKMREMGPKISDQQKERSTDSLKKLEVCITCQEWTAGVRLSLCSQDSLSGLSVLPTEGGTLKENTSSFSGWAGGRCYLTSFSCIALSCFEMSNRTDSKKGQVWLGFWEELSQFSVTWLHEKWIWNKEERRIKYGQLLNKTVIEPFCIFAVVTQLCAFVKSA